MWSQVSRIPVLTNALGSRISSLATAGLDLLYPPRCAGCSREGQFICDSCLSEQPRLMAPYCLACAQPLPRGSICADCRSTPLAISAIRAPFLMEGAIRHAVHQLKYGNLRAIAPQLGRLLADFMISEDVSGDALVPIPLHGRRERQRGYNQARLLAFEAGKQLEVTVASGYLSRVSNSPPQARSQSAADRKANVKDSFYCPVPSEVEGKILVLMDDVCTTGATLDACASVLMEAGAAQVYGVTLAREA